MKLQLFSRGGLHVPTPFEAYRMGVNTLEQLGSYQREFWGQTSEVFFPKRTPHQLVRDLEMYGPLHDAEVGLSAVEYGQKKDDWEVVFFGGAMAVKAMVVAYEAPKIPDFVTRQIVDGVIDHHIIPAEQPLLTDEMVKRSEPPIRKYGREVLDLFPSLENKL